MRHHLDTLRTFLRRARRPRQQTVVDGIFTAGLSAVAFGFGLYSLPAGFVVGGILAALWALQANSQLESGDA